jgi:FkbM family methyltransferase
MKRYPFGKFLLDIPDDHKIVSIHREAAFYDRAFGFVLEEISRTSPDGVLLDIGGNIGDTAAFFASYVSNPIVSVEGNPDFTSYFKSNLRHFGDQVRLVEKFIRTDSLADLKLAYSGGAGTGVLSVTESDALDDETFMGTDDLLKELGPLSLIKTDTDGFDGFIISDMLAKAPDVPLFFECDTTIALPGVENPWPGVFAKLNDYAVVVFDNQGLPMLVAEENAEKILRDLSGYLHLQRCVHPVRIYYTDIWAFPRSWKSTFDAVAALLRADMLKPYGF